MQSENMEKKRFNGDPQMLDKVHAQAVWQIIAIIFGIVVLLLAVYFGDRQEECWSGSDAWKHFRFIKICCIFLGVLEIGISPILLYSFFKTEENVKSTYLIVHGDKVEGIHYISSTVALPFSLSYSDIIEAEVLPGDAYGNVSDTIRIRAESGDYTLFAIEQKYTAVKLINVRKALFDKQGSRAGFSSGPMGTAGVEGTVRYCVYCAAELPADASFCYNCGKKQENGI